MCFFPRDKRALRRESCAAGREPGRNRGGLGQPTDAHGRIPALFDEINDASFKPRSIVTAGYEREKSATTGVISRVPKETGTRVAFKDG